MVFSDYLKGTSPLVLLDFPTLSVEGLRNMDVKAMLLQCTSPDASVVNRNQVLKTSVLHLPCTFLFSPGVSAETDVHRTTAGQRESQITHLMFQSTSSCGIASTFS